MTNVDVITQLYRDFAAGNIAGALAVFDPAMLWQACPGMAIVQGDGTYTGPDAVVSQVFMQLPVCFDGVNLDVLETFGSGDKGAC